MTMLTKPLCRELPLTFDHDKWIAEFHTWGIKLRRKRTRIIYTIAWTTVIEWTLKRNADIEYLARRAERDERRKKTG